MEAVLQKMRGAYKSHSDDRKTSRTIDGVQMAKRRKLNSMVSGTSESPCSRESSPIADLTF